MWCPCEENRDPGEDAGDQPMSCFPGKVVLASLVGSLSAGVAETFQWIKDDSKVTARKLAKEATTSNKNMLNYFRDHQIWQVIELQHLMS